MSNKAIVSLFLLLFFVVAATGCASFAGYFADIKGHEGLMAALGWSAGLLLIGGIASTINLFLALWE